MQGQAQGEVAPRPGEFEVDVELLAFAHRYATGPIKWDIVVFFGENPYTQDTAEAIARRIGRRAPTVLRELFDLSFKGFLERRRLDGKVVFALSRSPKVRRTLSRFVAVSRGQGPRF